MMNLRRLLVRDQVLALGLALLALVALVWIGLSQLAWANAEGRVLADLRQVERQLEQRLVGMERLAEAVGEQWVHGELDPVDGALCWRLLHPWVNREEHLTGVNLVRTDGQGFGLGQTGRAWGGRGVLAEGAAFRFGPILGDPGEVASAPPKVAPDFRQRPWFQAGARATQGFWTEPFTFAARREGQPGISYVLPVRDAKGILKGVISLDLLLEGLTQVVWESRVTPGSSLMVVDAGGRVIAPPAGGGMSQSEARRKVFLSSVSPPISPSPTNCCCRPRPGTRTAPTSGGGACIITAASRSSPGPRDRTGAWCWPFPMKMSWPIPIAAWGWSLWCRC